MTPGWLKTGPIANFAAFAAVIGIFLWMYWPEFKELFEVWLKSDEYSSGLLVPILGAYVIWSKRDAIFKEPFKPCYYGLVLILFGQAIRLLGLFLWFASAQRISIIVSLWGAVLFLFGSKAFKRLVPVLIFLVLMLPFPKSVHNNIMQPLQNWATGSAVFCLETAGFDVSREGNIIHIGSSSVAVAEACNGLRMITAFFVISSLVVLLIERTWWEKVIVLASALPIGLFCNTLRLTVTAIAFTYINGENWEKAFHDFGGLAMMPIALAAIMAELWFLKKVNIESVYDVKTVQAA
jgi:exosortase